MSDELFQSEKKIRACSPMNAYQQCVITILWIALWIASIYIDFHPHHHPVSTAREIFDFVLFPALCVANIFVYFKLRSKERAA